MLSGSARFLTVPTLSESLAGRVGTFVLAELMKARAVASTPFEIYHYRDRERREIDFMLESQNGRVIGIEVKASVFPTGRRRSAPAVDAGETGRPVHRNRAPLGSRSVSLGDGIWSVPMSALWSA